MESKKSKKDDIIEKIDKAINELVYDKTQIIKSYNYYHGKRDPEQFRHLEENYGIGTPTSVEFVPLVRKHVDILVGEYLSTPLLPKVSCKDSTTLSNINFQKQNKAVSEVTKILNKYLKDSLSAAMEGKQLENNTIDKNINDTKELITGNFISDYEIAGQNIVDYSCQSRNIDFINKRKILLTDLLVSGTCYYQVLPTPNNNNVELKALNPIHTFIERNPNSVYLKDSPRAVVREYLTKQQILSLFGDLLNEDDLEILETQNDLGFDDSTTTYIRSYNSTYDSTLGADGILGGFEVTPLLPYERNNSKWYRTYPVYHVEWLKAEKENGEYITNRYEGIRIGTSIYIPIGKSENVIRSVDNPKSCTLTINGIFYSDRNGDPTSLILSTANLQDKYDCLHFFRDNIIAESGTVGDWIDVAHLPAFLGKNTPERLLKWKAYGKSGIKVYDSSQEGQMINTSFNGFDDTLKLQTIQAIDLAIQRLEETCSSITGVFRERLGGIEQRDAVTNVQVGIRNSSLITKQYYQLMDLITREILIDILNISKIVFKNGLTGTIVLGEKLNKIFTALPEHFTVTDYDINITDSSEIIKDQELMKQVAMEFAKGGVIDPDIIFDIISAKSLTKLKFDIKESLNKKKFENNQLGQLSQQVEQLNQQLQQTVNEANSLRKKVESLNEEKIQIEREKLKLEENIRWFEAKSKDSFNTNKLKLDEKRVELEGLQLIDDSKQNDEIKND